MAATAPTDIAIKTSWDTLVPQMAIYQGGLLSSPVITKMSGSLLDSGGVTANIPFLKKWTGSVTKPTSNSNTSVEALGTTYDNQFRIVRSKIIAEEYLTVQTNGSSLLQLAMPKAVDYWSGQYETEIFYCLKGIFASALADGTHNVDASTQSMSWDVIAYAKSRFGQFASKLNYIIMHSAQFWDLSKSGLVAMKEAGTLGYDIWVKGLIPTILDMPIIVNDYVNTSGSGGATVYSAYIMGAGAINFRIIRFETKPYYDGVVASGTDHQIMNSAHIPCYIPGLRFAIASATDAVNPANADLYNSALWSSVAESVYDIPIVEVKTIASGLSI